MRELLDDLGADFVEVRNLRTEMLSMTLSQALITDLSGLTAFDDDKHKEVY